MLRSADRCAVRSMTSKKLRCPWWEKCWLMTFLEADLRNRCALLRLREPKAICSWAYRDLRTGRSCLTNHFRSSQETLVLVGQFGGKQIRWRVDTNTSNKTMRG